MCENCKETKILNFGKQQPNTYKIIEIEYKNNDIKYYIAVKENLEEYKFDNISTFSYDNETFNYDYIYNEFFMSYDSALKKVEELKKEENKIVVIKHKIY